jgi:hypothetical protein
MEVKGAWLGFVGRLLHRMAELGTGFTSNLDIVRACKVILPWGKSHWAASVL